MMTADELAVVLFELAQAPKKEEWIARWRPELIDALAIVIQWAVGRVSPEIARRLPKDRLPSELSDAALLFVKRVCFAADGTYYEVFGLTPETMSPERLRSRYRALIRLTHPDVGVKGLPEDAAGLVNRAYAVLGNERERRTYDERLAASTREPSFPSSDPVDSPAPSGRHSAGHKRRARKRPFVHEVGMGERMLARWVMINARWPRQLQLFLIGAAFLVPVGVVLLWNLSDDHGVDTIVARVPNSDDAVAQERDAFSQDTEQAGHMLRSEKIAQDRGGHDRAGRFLEPEAVAAHDDGSTDVVAGVDAVRQDGSDEVAYPVEGDGSTSGGRVVNGGIPERWNHVASETLVARGASSEQSAATEEGQDAMADEELRERQVDWSVARRYLQDIALAVGSEAETRSLNDDLEQMNVKGSLLRPVMALQRERGSSSVHYSTWSLSAGQGLFDAETMLTVRVAADGVDPAARTFLLRARFQATDHGTRLDTLDLQPLQ